MDNLKYIFKSWYWKSFLSVVVTFVWFNTQVMKKLWENRHKGNKMRWSMDSQAVLFGKFQEEVKELEDELFMEPKALDLFLALGISPYDKNKIVFEAADGAAFLMMIADRAHSKDFIEEVGPKIWAESTPGQSFNNRGKNYGK